jgi:hypothetical protein
MTSGKLVEICRNTMCTCDCIVYCEAYYKQFGCYPYEVVIGRSYFDNDIPPEANSNVHIQISDLDI